MIDYKKMSDFNINLLVAKSNGLLVKEVFEESKIGFTERYHAQYPNTIWAAKHKNGEQIEAWEQINYCTHPEEMMPLCFEHGIELSPLFSGEWCASYIKSYTFDEEPIYDDKYQSVHKNGLRAAAIVYLKVMESE